MSDVREQQNAASTRSMTFKLPGDLYRSIANDAHILGVSISAAARLRLQSGHVPTFEKESAKV